LVLLGWNISPAHAAGAESSLVAGPIQAQPTQLGQVRPTSFFYVETSAQPTRLGWVQPNPIHFILFFFFLNPVHFILFFFFLNPVHFIFFSFKKKGKIHVFEEIAISPCICFMLFWLISVCIFFVKKKYKSDIKISRFHQNFENI
jgi:hypothetical protein